jgi:formylglycine-generating enzyme required for sulfatase activity
MAMVALTGCDQVQDLGRTLVVDSGRPDYGVKVDVACDDPECCQADCNNAKCGADNGCGHPCKVGECPSGATCVDGACLWPTSPNMATWVIVSAGTFVMGSPESEPCRFTNEDQHTVTLTHSFEIQSTEVTQDQFRGLLGYETSKNQGCAQCPVDYARWYDAVAYCSALSHHYGLDPCYSCTGGRGIHMDCRVKDAYEGDRIYKCPGYRLPTEAEWEYAYRAGSTTAYYNGPNHSKGCLGYDTTLNAIAWYHATATDQRPRVVGKKKPNANGLHDMSGNVEEWCHDRWAGSLGGWRATDPAGSESHDHRVVRGGSVLSLPARARAASRGASAPDAYLFATGFRCVRTLP